MSPTARFYALLGLGGVYDAYRATAETTTSREAGRPTLSTPAGMRSARGWCPVTSNFERVTSI
jgi:hypothetical protein